MSLIITSDVMLNRNAFVTKDGYCATDIEDNTKRSSLQIVIALLFLIISVQMIMFGLGMIMYFLVSRDFCALKTTDVKACSTLVSTSGLHLVLFLFSFILIRNQYPFTFDYCWGSCGTINLVDIVIKESSDVK